MAGVDKETTRYLKKEGWPESGWVFGPFTCGGKCKVHHAFARCIEYTPPFPFSETYPEPIRSIVYERPCTDNAEAKLKSGGPSW